MFRFFIFLRFIKESCTPGILPNHTFPLKLGGGGHNGAPLSGGSICNLSFICSCSIKTYKKKVYLDSLFL